jgi:hypothetical protein
MDLALLATLKDKLVNAKNFSQVWEYFFDHFGEDAEFIAQGERARDSFLEAVLAEVGKELFGRPVRLTNLLLTRLADQHFLHGACAMDGRLANVLYFEDIRVGLLAVIASFTPGETKMVRFSGQRVPVNPTPSPN